MAGKILQRVFEPVSAALTKGGRRTDRRGKFSVPLAGRKAEPGHTYAQLVLRTSKVRGFGWVGFRGSAARCVVWLCRTAIYKDLGLGPNRWSVAP